MNIMYTIISEVERCLPPAVSSSVIELLKSKYFAIRTKQKFTSTYVLVIMIDEMRMTKN